MDATAPAPIRYNRLLPYWAVLRTDLRETLRSWVFRLWVILSLSVAAGYGLYKGGIHIETGVMQSAAGQFGDLLRAVAAASLALVSLLAVGAISQERSTVADAVLSRGISRRQFFLAKWHSRTVVAVVAQILMSVTVLTCYHALLMKSDVTFRGAVAATAVTVSILAAVVAWGVTVGALASGTLIGITLFWLVLYGVIVLCSFLPEPFPSPSFVIGKLQAILRGHFDEADVFKIIAGFLGVGLIGATIGLIGFARKDV